MRRVLLVCRAWLVLVAMRVAISTLRFAAVRRLATRWGRRSPVGRPVSAGSVVRAVHRAARFVPGSTCLTRALAAHVLLCRMGYSPRLRIGLATDAGPPLMAHAWLELAGVVVIGGGDLEDYVPLPALGKP
jgi:hypothetical protein